LKLPHPRHKKRPHSLGLTYLILKLVGNIKKHYCYNELIFPLFSLPVFLHSNNFGYVSKYAIDKAYFYFFWLFSIIFGENSPSSLQFSDKPLYIHQYYQDQSAKIIVLLVVILKDESNHYKTCAILNFPKIYEIILLPFEIAY